jgi:hypothetical protein
MNGIKQALFATFFNDKKPPDFDLDLSLSTTTL